MLGPSNPAYYIDCRIWRLPPKDCNCLISAWQLDDNCLTTAWWLPDNLIHNSNIVDRQVHDDSNLTLFLLALGKISPYMSIMWQQLVGKGLKSNLDVRAKKVGKQLQRQVGISGYEAARIFAKPKKTRKKQLLSSSLLYALVAFRNSKKQLSQLEEEKFKSSCQFYGSIFFW